MSKWTEATVFAPDKLRIMEKVALPPAGSTVLVQVRKARNIRHHRLYWALLRAVVEATDQWAAPDELHRWIKLELGHYVPHVQPEGTVLCELLPTDFAKMDQFEFGDFYGRALAAIALSTGIDAEALIEETWT